MLVYWLWYALLPDLTLRQKQKILRCFQSPYHIYHTERSDLQRAGNLDVATIKHLENKDLSQAQQLSAHCSEHRIGIITYGDAAYPSQLRNLPDAPLVLYTRGYYADLGSRPVVVVAGTRKTTSYGDRMAQCMGAQLSACGALVLSGGTEGIDTQGLLGALSAEKHAAVMLPSGVDVPYPQSNAALFEKITESGCLISEYPPGTPALRWHFRRRNQLLSAICNAVVVIEAPEGSGSLTTARFALEQGKEVYVIPSNLDNPTFFGSNALLQEGAQPVLEGWDILKQHAPFYPATVQYVPNVFEPEDPEAFMPVPAAAAPKRDKKGIDKKTKTTYSVLNTAQCALSEEERTVMEQVPDLPQPIDEVIARISLPSGKALSILTRLSLKGVVKNHPGKLVSKNGG